MEKYNNYKRKTEIYSSAYPEQIRKYMFFVCELIKQIIVIIIVFYMWILLFE